MTSEPSEVLRAGLALSPADREDVALRLLESVDPAVDQDEVDRAWVAEISRRVNEIRAGKTTMLTWAQMRAKLDADRAARRG